MTRLPRPKLIAEFAIFLFIATAIIHIALHLTSSAYSSDHKTSRIEDKAIQGNQDIFSKTGINGSSIDAAVASGAKADSSHGIGVKSPTGRPAKRESSSSSSVNKVGQTLASDDSLKNLSKPYYNFVSDTELKIDRSYFRLRPTRISTIPDQFPIASGTVCKPDSPSILFIIPSVASSNVAAERFEIRKTWASGLYGPTYKQTSPVRLLFFFGSSGLTAKQLEFLKEESGRYNDIVVGEFLDSYHNLSLKMAVTISWVAKNCPDIKAAIKIDMDTYVNVKLLLKLIDQLPHQTHPHYVFGHMHGARQPLVVRTGGWAVPESVYPFNKFPRYIYGHSYVISGSAVKLMAEGFPSFPIVPNEDAFATGIIPVTLNITRFHHDSFAYLLEKRTLCDITKGIHVTAVMKKENRLKLWNAFQTGACFKDSLR